MKTIKVAKKDVKKFKEISEKSFTCFTKVFYSTLEDFREWCNKDCNLTLL